VTSESIYRFGTFEVRPRVRQVRNAGAVVEAQPKAFDLLLYLIENRDRVVDKDELLTKLWPGTVVSESALTQVVRKARSLVGDDGSRQTIIRTIQRRGFRFVATLDPTSEAPRAEAAVAPRAAEPSVAVLPFVDMSPERDQEYFCDGMVEEIINELAKIPDLRVAARTSTFAFKNRPDDVREIGRRLGVQSVLEGSVRKAGDRLRVTAQLIDADSGFHLWSQRWDRGIEDMLAVQTEIAHRIASALRRPRDTEAEASVARFTADDLCDRGFAYLHRHGRRSQRFAIDLFRQALVLDPRSVGAWAGLALSHAVLFRTSDDRHLAEAQFAAARATELEPRAAQSSTARGAAAAIAGDFDAAEAAFRQAIDYDPAFFEAYYYYAHACTEAGQYRKAAELYEQAAELRPDDYQALVFACQAYRSLGQRDDEKDAALRQLARAERALATDPTDARALSLSTGPLITLGRVPEALAWSVRACALEPDEPYVHYNAACSFAVLGETEQALAAIERGIVGGRLCRPAWIEHDDDLASIREHPRFKALFAAAGGAAKHDAVGVASGRAAESEAPAARRH
jgi:adenylate cyclase